jgi:hypothetical protein
MKTINTEELVIASVLLLGEAIAAITTHLLVPGDSLILAGLGWRPPTGLEVEPPSTTPEELHKAFAVLTDPAMGVPWEDAIPAAAPAPAQPGRNWSRRQLQPFSLRQLRDMAERRRLDYFGLTKPELIEVILDDIDRQADDYSREVPTAEERSPSLRRGKR